MDTPPPPRSPALPAPTLVALAGWVRATLGEGFPAPTNGVWSPGDGRPIRRLGIARVGGGAVARAACCAAVDALLLHRPWFLEPLPPELGVLVVHEALDERLTTGENPWLAQRLGFTLGEGIGGRTGRPLVSLAHAAEPPTVRTLLARLRQEFPTLEVWRPRPLRQRVHTIALATAMRPALVGCAAHRGATLYLTGTLRPEAYPSLMQTEMAALGLGHAAAEHWGLRWLAQALTRTFATQVVWLEDVEEG